MKSFKGYCRLGNNPVPFRRSESSVEPPLAQAPFLIYQGGVLATIGSSGILFAVIESRDYCALNYCQRVEGYCGCHAPRLSPLPNRNLVVLVLPGAC